MAARRTQPRSFDVHFRGGAGGTDVAYFQTRTETGYNFDNGTVLGQPLALNLDNAANRDIPVRWHREHNLVSQEQGKAN